MKRLLSSYFYVPLLSVLLTFFIIIPTVQADIVTTGTTTEDLTSIGYWGLGTLSVTGGSSASSYNSFLGASSDGIGEATVSGGGSIWTITHGLAVGVDGGTGSLTISNGGTVVSEVGYIAFSDAANGTVTVDGADSTWTLTSLAGLEVGRDGTGKLTITNGGTVTTSGSVDIGESGEDGTGTVTVDGNGSILSASYDINVYKNGTLSVTDGGTVASDEGDIWSGTVIVDGAESIWTLSDSLSVGYSGAATLAITNGGSVTSNSGAVYGTDGGGTVIVDGQDSSWAVSQELIVGYDEAGSLAITNGGSVTSDSGYIDSSSEFGGGVSVDGEGSSWTIENELYIGYDALRWYSGDDTSASLSITNGGTVTSSSATLGVLDTDTGTVTVDGDGSTWDIDGDLFIGYWGSGIISITNGGEVTSDSSYIGCGDVSEYDGETFIADGTGEVTVDGEDSVWDNSGDIYLGDIDTGYGTGTLTIINGGQVSADSISINSNSSLTIDIGTDSYLDLGNGDITNEGTINLVISALADSGDYTPISYGSMDGDGDVQTLGGLWNPVSHKFIVRDNITVNGVGGGTATLDLSENQRAMITDSNTGMSVGASFAGGETSTVSTQNLNSTVILLSAAGIQQEEASTSISFTAEVVTDETLLADLAGLIADNDEEILSAWELSATDYDDEIYLSLSASFDGNVEDLTIWYLLNDEWSEYDASDLTYDGTYASFTISELGTYAVTGTSSVPIPGAVGLLGTGLLFLAGLRRKRQ
nr:hypothetical protein [uncultured Desulfobacter sp.]